MAIRPKKGGLDIPRGRDLESRGPDNRGPDMFSRGQRFGVNIEDRKPVDPRKQVKPMKQTVPVKVQTDPKDVKDSAENDRPDFFWNKKLVKADNKAGYMLRRDAERMEAMNGDRKNKTNPWIPDDRNGPGNRPTKPPKPSSPKPGDATQAKPVATAIRPASNEWSDIVKAYFPKPGGNVYKDGGVVRGGGAARRGRGRGKMC